MKTMKKLSFFRHGLQGGSKAGKLTIRSKIVFTDTLVDLP